MVPKIEDSLGEIKKFLKFDTTSVPSLIGSQKVNVCFLKVGEIYLEFIEPTAEDSPVSNFVKSGGGYHHICFEVQDIHKEIKNIIDKGGRLVVEPVKGFEDRMIAFVFLNMKNTKCNLIELAEKKST